MRLPTKSVVEGSIVTDIPADQAIGNDYKLIFPIDGDPQKYPIDRYSYSYELSHRPKVFVAAPLLKIERMDGGDPRPVPVSVWRDPKGLEGWTENWDLLAEGHVLKAKLDMDRSGGALAFVFIILTLLVIIANLAILVAWSGYTARRPIETGFAGWLTALLFALIPLRTNLPGAPPIVTRLSRPTSASATRVGFQVPALVDPAPPEIASRWAKLPVPSEPSGPDR